jgi:hypothetical protein
VIWSATTIAACQMISNVAAYAFWLPTLRMRRDRRPAAAFVAEYPCVRFCRIEVELNGERGLVPVPLRPARLGQHRQQLIRENRVMLQIRARGHRPRPSDQLITVHPAHPHRNPINQPIPTGHRARNGQTSTSPVQDHRHLMRTRIPTAVPQPGLAGTGRRLRRPGCVRRPWRHKGHGRRPIRDRRRSPRSWPPYRRRRGRW